MQHRIPIRDSANATHKTLVRICDTVFGAEVAKEEREAVWRYSIEDLVRMEAAARRIERAFFRRRAERRDARRRRNGGNREGGEADRADRYFDDEGCCDGEGSRCGDDEDYRRQSILRCINEGGGGYNEEIEVDWRKPSWKFAKRSEAQSRPHRSGRRMRGYDWTTVTLGRHCHAGGCGKQLDLWNEGRTSEFSQFGSGITNYFKGK